MVKRYDFHQGERGYHCVVEWEDGEYVEYEEHAAELATLRAENAVMRDKLENLVIAYGMGWDMDDVIEAAKEALK